MNVNAYQFHGYRVDKYAKEFCRGPLDIQSKVRGGLVRCKIHLHSVGND